MGNGAVQSVPQYWWKLPAAWFYAQPVFFTDFIQRSKSEIPRRFALSKWKAFVHAQQLLLYIFLPANGSVCLEWLTIIRLRFTGNSEFPAFYYVFPREGFFPLRGKEVSKELWERFKLPKQFFPHGIPIYTSWLTQHVDTESRKTNLIFIWVRWVTNPMKNYKLVNANTNVFFSDCETSTPHFTSLKSFTSLFSCW